MESIDYWRFCNELSVVQAAFLMCGVDPRVDAYYIKETDPQNWPIGYDAVSTGLKNFIKSGRLKAYSGGIPITVNITSCDESKIPEESCGIPLNPKPNWSNITIIVEDLVELLKIRGFKDGFFVTDETNDPDYLDPNHEHYSPKLAAAIQAWQAVTQNPDLQRAKSTKRALIVWLRKNANLFGLTKDDGNPNETGIEEVAKIANWNPRGGAPKSPQK